MDTRHSTSFLCKKWALFSFCLIGIVGTIVIAALASSIIDKYVDDNYHFNGSFRYTKEELDSIKESAKIIVYVAAVFVVLFQLLGLVGTYKEHYCMTMTYTILMTLGLVGSIVNAIRIDTFWAGTVLYLIILSLAYSFLYDLRQIRRELFTQRVFVSNPVPTSTHIQIAGTSTVYGGQYESQYANTNQSYYQNQPQYNTQSQDPWQSPPPPPPYQEKSGLP